MVDERESTAEAISRQARRPVGSTTKARAAMSLGRYTKHFVAMMDHPIVGVSKTDPLTNFEAWQWLINKAAYERRRTRTKGKVIWLEPGQLPGGRDYLAKQWHWGAQRVRTFLSLLSADGMIEINQSKGHYPNIISISNYNIYQDAKGVKKTRAPTSVQPVRNQSVTSAQPDSQNIQAVHQERETPSFKVSPARVARDERPRPTEAQQQQAAALNPSEAEAQVSVAWTEDGRIEVKNGFRSELLSKLGGDEIVLRDSLDEAAGYVGANLTGMKLQQAVRAQVAKQSKWTRQRQEERAAAGVKSKPRRSNDSTALEQAYARAKVRDAKLGL